MARSSILVWVAALLVCAALAEACFVPKLSSRARQAKLDDFDNDSDSDSISSNYDEMARLPMARSKIPGCIPDYRCYGTFKRAVCGSDGRVYICHDMFLSYRECDPSLREKDMSYCILKRATKRPPLPEINPEGELSDGDYS